MWTSAFHLVFPGKMRKCRFFQPFSLTKSVFPPSELFAIDRFVRMRSSSSKNLAASAHDDLRAEQAAIALSLA